MSNSRALRLALLPMCFALAAGESLAQDVTIDFTNAAMEPIPLLNGTTVGIKGDGNLTAQCVLGDTDVCEGISTGGPVGPVPVAALTRTNGTGTINTGGTLALNWSALPAAEICLATSSPVVNGWNNTLVAAGGGTVNLTMSVAGDFTLSLKCYNASGVSNTATLNAKVQGSGPVNSIPACNVPGLMETGRVQPQGFTGHLLQWPEIFYGATFPNMPSFLAPTGSFSLKSLGGDRGPPMNARYLTVPFTPTANANYKISWLGAQAVNSPGTAGYSNPRGATSVFVSVSPCAGDLRGKDSVGPETAVCRGQVKSGAIFFGTTANSQCKLNPSQSYFLNIAFVGTSGTGPLSLTETTCAEGGRCEANFDN